ncbi:hypothetical protein HMY34_19650 [Thiothrix subterranea]|nr:hypothetical protein [Thiothrix subterranea]QQZ30790.1 hypothetical protein HMY34_19650 [Thiothrix subterranea]
MEELISQLNQALYGLSGSLAAFDYMLGALTALFIVGGFMLIILYEV